MSDTKALWKAKEKKDAKDRKEDARKAAENLHLLEEVRVRFQITGNARF